jgi:hypothetical protein
MSDTTGTDLIQQGLTATRVGDIEDARRLLRQATREQLDNVEAWLGLAGVVESLEEKQKCFAQALALDPDNSEAKAGLAIVEQKLAIAPAKQVSPDHSHDHSDEAQSVVSESGLAFCYRHPDVETGLRCNRCNRPICPKCARRTPVGFRCPDCIREQEDKFYTGSNLDYVIAAVIAFPLSLVAAALFTFVLNGFGFFMILIAFFVAPAAGGIIAEAVRWGVGKRRSRYLRHIVVGCIILAGAPFLLLTLLSGSLYGLIGPGMFVFLASSTVLARLR